MMASNLLALVLASWIEFGAGFSAPHPHDMSSLSSCQEIDRCNDADDAIISIEADNKHSRTGYLTNHGRRKFLSQLASSTIAVGSPLLLSAQNANALPFIGGPERRQLELCLVTILRTEYWAMTVAKSFKANQLLSPTTIDTDGGNSTETVNTQPEMSANQRKQPYLQARLGAKALLTQKIGGGANSRVMKLGTLQLKECLDDARYWCGELAKKDQLPAQLTDEVVSTKNGKRICTNDLSDAIDELVESLASIVEFDGLETTIDPSPRSSLMLSMYNNQKGTFVYRTIVERVVPGCDRFLEIFGSERRRVVEDFVRRDYGDEVPFEVLEKMYDSE